MKVRLVSVTESRLESPTLTPEELIVYIARVSNPSNQANTETAANLLRYCVEHKHWSVFESVSMTVEITTSRAISAQILRHRSFTFQEFSQRYAQATFIEPFELRRKAEKNRQSSIEVDEREFYEQAKMADKLIQSSMDVYHHLLDSGVAPETARMVLPMSTQTTLYMTGNIRSWIHYLQQRTSPDTQKEHREVALAIKEIFETEFPTIASVVFNNQ